VNKSSGDGDGDVQERKFDLILLSDLVFNHSQHLALLNTCLSCLSSPASSSSSSYSTSKSATETPRETSMPTRPSKEEGEEESKVDLSDPTTLETPAVLCFFSHHRPWLVDADLQILQLARDKGWRVSKVWEDKQAGVSGPYSTFSRPLFLRENRGVEKVRLIGRDGWLTLGSRALLHLNRTACFPGRRRGPRNPEYSPRLALHSPVEVGRNMQ
jgi:hypothetical protein